VDPELQLSSQILLTATCFPGVDGYRDTHYATEYEIDLYDHTGKAVPLENNGRLEVGSLRPTLVNLAEWAHRDSFFGGAKVRVAPSPHQMPHAGDLFSAGFVRWDMPGNFDNIHAQPAAPQQLFGHFNYSMPFPPLAEYHCAFALFNLDDDESFGNVRVVDRLGRTVVERAYRLRPHQTAIYGVSDLKAAATPGEALAIVPLNEPKLAAGGVIVVRNDSEKAAFAYTFMKGRTGGSFTVEHPLHFAAGALVKPARATPFNEKGAFPAEALVFTPMLFRGAVVNGVKLETRLHLSASRWQEEALWMLPFVTTGEGRVAWASNKDAGAAGRIAPSALVQNGAVRLSEFQSCSIDAAALPLPEGFTGGFGASTIPRTSHSLNKVEVRAVNWGRVAMTHFRPGGSAASAVRTVDDRGGLASDYIVSGAHVIGTAANRKRDTLLAIMNIEAAGEPGSPLVQLFGPGGLVASRQLGEYPPMACRHFLVSDIFPGVQSDPAHPFTVRMQSRGAMMIVSALHFDYERRDIALEHGSDRHSTFRDYKC
jgi:hypothetical protein